MLEEIVVAMYEDDPEINIVEVATQELNTLSNQQLFQMFQFYYNVNREVPNITTAEKFCACLESFDRNPFRIYDDIAYRQEMIANLIQYTDDHDSLIIASQLIKSNYNVQELIASYYSSINAFDNDLF